LILKFRLPKEINPHRNMSFGAKTVAILPKICSPELCKNHKKIKNKIKNI